MEKTFTYIFPLLMVFVFVTKTSSATSKAGAHINSLTLIENSIDEHKKTTSGNDKTVKNNEFIYAINEPSFLIACQSFTFQHFIISIHYLALEIKKDLPKLHLCKH